MGSYSFVTFNVRGIRDSKKRRKLFSFLHTHKYDFIYLQETHSIPSDNSLWVNEWGGKAYLSHGSNCSKGVAILIKPTIAMTVINLIIDVDGRFIILNINCNDMLFELINIYGHNVDNVSLFSKLESYISNHEWDSIIWGGDFNFVMNLSLDKVGGNAHTNFRATNKVTYDGNL